MAPLSDPERMKILGQCSLVSSWWFIRARHWMFYDIEVKIGGIEYNFERARELLKHLQSPHSTIAQYLRYVYIGHGPRVHSPYEPLNELIVDVLPHLQDEILLLELETILWSNLDESAQACILRMHPDSLCLIYSDSPTFGSPFDMLALSSKINPYLKALKIAKSGSFDENSPLGAKLAPLPLLLPHLHTLHLTLNVHVAFFDANVALFRIPTLRTVTLEFDPSVDNLSLLRCIEDTGSNLRYLTLSVDGYLKETRGSKRAFKKALKRADYDPDLFVPSLHRNVNLSSLLGVGPGNHPGSIAGKSYFQNCFAEECCDADEPFQRISNTHLGSKASQ
ncbi:hypothetical protein H0H92_002168 [Tricholoma furcatifolium]|nr:hypothetical protein H0H92_002168 [Tricholoma furcatifolium]